MGASLNEIKTRIASTKNEPNHAGNADGVASKLTKSEASSQKFQVYATKVREIVTHLTATQLNDIASENPRGDINYNKHAAQPSCEENWLYRHHCRWRFSRWI